MSEIASFGGTAIADTTNVTDHLACQALIQRAVEIFGGLDLLVNAAGVLRDRMIFSLSEEDWDTVIAVHLKGSYNTIRYASAYWREHRNEDGPYRLINFTSGSGLFGSPAQPNYAAAKMGVVGLTLCAAIRSLATVFDQTPLPP